MADTGKSLSAQTSLACTFRLDFACFPTFSPHIGPHLSSSTPPIDVFFNSMWNNLSSKRAHARLIYGVTRIDDNALIGSGGHEDFTVAGFGRFCLC